MLRQAQESHTVKFPLCIIIAIYIYIWDLPHCECPCCIPMKKLAIATDDSQFPASKYPNNIRVWILRICPQKFSEHLGWLQKKSEQQPRSWTSRSSHNQDSVDKGIEVLFELYEVLWHRLAVEVETPRPWFWQFWWVNSLWKIYIFDGKQMEHLYWETRLANHFVGKHIQLRFQPRSAVLWVRSMFQETQEPKLACEVAKKLVQRHGLQFKRSRWGFHRSGYPQIIHFNGIFH